MDERTDKVDKKKKDRYCNHIVHVRNSEGCCYFRKYTTTKSFYIYDNLPRVLSQLCYLVSETVCSLSNKRYMYVILSALSMHFLHQIGQFNFNLQKQSTILATIESGHAAMPPHQPWHCFLQLGQWFKSTKCTIDIKCINKGSEKRVDSKQMYRVFPKKSFVC